MRVVQRLFVDANGEGWCESLPAGSNMLLDPISAVGTISLCCNHKMIDITTSRNFDVNPFLRR